MGTVYYKTCDHCGKKLDEGVGSTDLDATIKNYRTVDLCADCLEKLDALVEQYVTANARTVSIVRCGECEHRNKEREKSMLPGTTYCRLHDTIVLCRDYCKNGMQGGSERCG